MRELPPYSYVPGKFPHPLRDERGHNFAAAAESCYLLDESNWSSCAAYLWGIDLFNSGYYWEAHETWEAIWHACSRRGTAADLLKGLIKLAAAGVKAREGRIPGVIRHARRASELFRNVTAVAVPSNGEFLGLVLGDLIHHADWLAEHGAEVVNTSDQPVVIVMPFRLAPHFFTRST